jgi:hypothetical protein
MDPLPADTFYDRMETSQLCRELKVEEKKKYKSG